MLSLASWQSSQLQIQGTAATFDELSIIQLKAVSLYTLLVCCLLTFAMLMAVQSWANRCHAWASREEISFAAYLNLLRDLHVDSLAWVESKA